MFNHSVDNITCSGIQNVTDMMNNSESYGFNNTKTKETGTSEGKESNPIANGINIYVMPILGMETFIISLTVEWSTDFWSFYRKTL